MKQRIFQFSIIIASLAIFTFALTKNAIIVTDQDGTMMRSISSIDCFFMGSTTFVIGAVREWFVWLANPISLLSIIIWLFKNKLAKISSIVSLVLAGSFVLWNEITENENGKMSKIISFESGYQLWLISIIILALGIQLFFYFEPKKR